MIIIYVNCALFPFVDLIIKGLKLYETRNRDTLKRFIGKTVYLAETGRHKRPVVKCSCDITGLVTITDRATYNRYRKYTKVKKGSCFDFNSDTKKKCLYRLENVKACEPFPVPDNAIRYGRIYSELI